MAPWQQAIGTGQYKYFNHIHDTNNIIYHNYVSDSKLIELYETSEIFVYPSIYEGFGLPLADALNFEIPIIALDTDINREVLETNASYFLNFEEFKDCFNSIKKNYLNKIDNQENNWLKTSEYLSNFK